MLETGERHPAMVRHFGCSHTAIFNLATQKLELSLTTKEGEDLRSQSLIRTGGLSYNIFKIVFVQLPKQLQKQ